MQRTTLHGLLLGAAILASAAALTSCGDGEEEAVAETTAEPSPTGTAVIEVAPVTPGPGTTVWRWGNVTLTIPDDSPLGFNPTSHLGPEDFPPDGGMAIELTNTESNVWIGAESGEVFIDNIRDIDRAAFESVLQTLEVSALDAARAGWPYSESITDGATRESDGTISFVRPHPSTGMFVGGWIGDGIGAHNSLTLTNGTSWASVVIMGDQALTRDSQLVLPEDKETFERWLASVQSCSAVPSC